LIVTNGTLVENKLITDGIEVNAANVVFRNCRVENASIHGINGTDATNLTIEHCTIIGSGGTGVSTGILAGGTITANDVSGFALGMSITGAATVKDNYVHDLHKDGIDVHYDGIAFFGGGNSLVEHNALWVPLQSGGGATACVFFKNFFGQIDNVTVRNNLLRGEPAYTFQFDGQTAGSTLSNLSIVNNVMETGIFGYFSVDVPPAATNITGSGNTDYLTGAVIEFPDFGVPPAVGPISFGSAGTYLTYGPRTNSTLVAPAGIVNNDLLIAYLAVGQTVSSPATPVAPAGWSTLPGSPLAPNFGGFFTKYNVFYKVASGESGNYVFTHPAASSCGVICRYPGVDPAAPLSPVPTASIGTGPVATATGFTTTVTNTFVIYTEQDWGTNANDTLPPGGSNPTFTERIDQTILYIADGTRGAPGVISNRSHNCNNEGAEGWAAFLIGLKPV
jgi:hypothetical protein